ncbi:TolB family protein [Amorphus orientalis]|uniref:Uncharacterized protein n=1 Tax=Amorphus orientalis TaxID=649198 RepID=A0AAE3VT65_9HYPH|nr:WD40 repeat domain-containing protein [Amorphus orientalis]MDQ0317735.1 hypothetical protein [Amorphus orientalis]
MIFERIPLSGASSDNVNDVSITPDGTHLSTAVSVTSAGQHVQAFTLSNAEFNRSLSFTSSLSGDYGYSARIHPGGDFLYAGIGSNLVIYERDGGTYSILRFNTSAAGLPRRVAVSPDDLHIAVATNTSGGGLYLLKKNGSSFSQIPMSAGDKPGTTAYYVAYSPDGQYLAVGYNGGSNLIVYRRSGDTYTRLPAPDVAPTSYCHHLNWSPDSSHLAASFSVDPGLHVYEVTPSAVTLVAARDVSGSPPRVEASFFLSIDSLLVLYGGGDPSPLFNFDGSTLSFNQDVDFGGYDVGQGRADITEDRKTIAMANGFPTDSIAVFRSPKSSGALSYPTFTLDAEVDLLPIEVSGEVTFPSAATNFALSTDQTPPPILPPVEVQAAYLTVESMGMSLDQGPPANPYLYAWTTFPALTAAAEARLGNKIQSEVIFPRLQSDGSLEWDLLLSGGASLPRFKAEGEAEARIVTVDAKVTFPVLSAAGEALVPNGGAVELSFPTFEADGEVGVPIVIEGEGGFQAFSVEGSVNVPLGAFVELNFPGLSVGSLGGYPIEGAGALDAPPFHLRGEIEVHIPDDYTVRSAARFPQFQILGEGLAPPGGPAEIRFPLFAAQGEVNVPLAAIAAVTLPTFGFDAFLSVPYRIDANGRFPALVIDGLAGHPVQIMGPISLPAFRASGKLNYRDHITMDATFPAFRVRGRDYQSLSLGGVALGLTDRGVTIGSGVTLWGTPSLRIG